MDNAERQFIRVQTTIFVVSLAVITTAMMIVIGKLRVTPETVANKVDALSSQVTERDHSVLLERSLSSSGEALVVVDEAGLITAWSEGATRLFGVSREDAIGYGLGFLMPENDPLGYRSKHRKGFGKAMDGSDTGMIVRHIVCLVKTVDGDRQLNLRVWAAPNVGAVARFAERPKETGT